MSANETPHFFSIAHDALEELVFSAEYDGRPSFALLQGHHDNQKVHINGFSSLQVVNLENAFNAVRKTLNEHLVVQTRTQLLGDDGVNPIHPSMGWFISQPGASAKPSDEILRVHFSLFNLPHISLLIYDPLSKRIALYNCDEKLQIRNKAFEVLPTEQTHHA